MARTAAAASARLPETILTVRTVPSESTPAVKATTPRAWTSSGYAKCSGGLEAWIRTSGPEGEMLGVAAAGWTRPVRVEVSRVAGAGAESVLAITRAGDADLAATLRAMIG